jgi:hypothetical protein
VFCYPFRVVPEPDEIPPAAPDAALPTEIRGMDPGELLARTLTRIVPVSSAKSRRGLFAGLALAAVVVVGGAYF